MRWGWLVLIAAGLRPAHAGPCNVRGSVEGKVLGQAGGLVVGAVATSDDFGNGPPPPPGGGWTLEVDGTSKGARFDMVAPGLGVIVLPAGATSGFVSRGSMRIPLNDGENKPLAAPKVTRVSSSSERRREGSMASTFTTVTAKVKTVPDGAVALVLFGIEKGKRVGRSWVAVDAGEGGEFTLYATQGRCTAQAPGEPSNVGDKVQLAWVDQSGKLSKPTGTLTVAKAK